MYVVNKTSGSPIRTPIHLRGETICGIAVYNEEVQPLNAKSTTNCTDLACDHICISTETGAKCLCSEGFKLNSVTKKCDEDLGKFYKAIVLASSTKICLAEIIAISKVTPKYSPVCVYTTDPNEIPTKPSTKATNNLPAPKPTVFPSVLHTSSLPPVSRATLQEIIVRITLDTNSRFVYFATNDGKIYRRSLDVGIEDTQREQLLTASGKSITGLDYDWISKGNLYWCEGDTGLIYIYNLQNKGVLKVDVSLETTHPRDLNILARERKLVWVAMDTSDDNNYAIYIADMTGKNAKPLISGRMQISSLTVDQDERLIYFIENGQIYLINFKGQIIPYRITSTGNAAVNSLQRYKNYLAWLEPNGDGTTLRTYITDDSRQGNEETVDSSTKFIHMKILDAKLQTTET